MVFGPLPFILSSYIIRSLFIKIGLAFLILKYGHLIEKSAAEIATFFGIFVLCFCCCCVFAVHNSNGLPPCIFLASFGLARSKSPFPIRVSALHYVT